MEPFEHRSVDLNADLGEEVTDDAALIAVVTSANVACGFHAGHAALMAQVCALAAEHGVRVGAQVSYLDREGFGRRPMDVPAAVLAEQVAEQVGLLGEAARASGIEVAYLKPHGALYNRVAEDADQAAAVLAGSGSLPVLGLPGGEIVDLAARAGRAVFLEGFPDRGYLSDAPGQPHRLLPRSEPGAVFDDADEIAERAVRLAVQGRVDSVCVHGDGRNAVRAALTVRRRLQESGLRVGPFL